MSDRIEDCEARLRRISENAVLLRNATSELKNKVLSNLETLLGAQEQEILERNREDLQGLSSEKSTPAFIDRLTLTPERIRQMRDSLSAVRGLPDPVGEVFESRTLPNGLKLRRVRAPLGVLFMIFEARPNVITEAFALALKSGNALILRGGRESLKTAAKIYELIRAAMSGAGLTPDIFWGLENPDRALAHHLMQQKRWIDVLIPRGGDSLIDYVTQNSKIPIIKNDRGLCHVYVDEDADLKQALDIAVNAKTGRPGVCNSMETLLVHARVAQTFLPEVYERMKIIPVKWYGCERTLALLHGRPLVFAATAQSWDTEYLDFVMNAKVVHDLNEALQHIAHHGSRHSEAIVTRSESKARLFQNSVDAAAVYWNASTRFTDGFEFGLGGELGISTQKLHVRGPVGLREMTSLRWLIDGQGQIRS